MQALSAGHRVHHRGYNSIPLES